MDLHWRDRTDCRRRLLLLLLSGWLRWNGRDRRAECGRWRVRLRSHGGGWLMLLLLRGRGVRVIGDFAFRRAAAIAKLIEAGARELNIWYAMKKKSHQADHCLKVMFVEPQPQRVYDRAQRAAQASILHSPHVVGSSLQIGR